MSKTETLYPSCPYPNCPSGQSAKASEERHLDVKSSLSRLEGGQQKIFDTMLNVATLVADVSNMKDDIIENETTHTEIFTRLRVIETTAITKSDMVKIISILGILVAVIESVFKWVLPK